MFYGTEMQRRRWVQQKGLQDRSVLLAANALRKLMGMRASVEVIIASGQDGLSSEDRSYLAQKIRLLNDLYGKKNQ